MDRPVCDVDLDLELANAGVKPEKRVDRKQLLPENDLQVGEDRAGLVVRRGVAILTEIPSKLSVASVLTARQERQRWHSTPSHQRTCCSRSSAGGSEPNISSRIIRDEHRWRGVLAFLNLKRQLLAINNLR
jgi:hypothetical protein